MDKRNKVLTLKCEGWGTVPAGILRFLYCLSDLYSRKDKKVEWPVWKQAGSSELPNSELPLSWPNHCSRIRYMPEPLCGTTQISLIPSQAQPKPIKAFIFQRIQMATFLDPPPQEYFAACFSMTLLLLTFLLWQGGVSGKHIGSDSSLGQRLGLLAAWRPRKCLIDSTLSSWAQNGFSASGYLGLIVDLLFLLPAWCSKVHCWSRKRRVRADALREAACHSVSLCQHTGAQQGHLPASLGGSKLSWSIPEHEFGWMGTTDRHKSALCVSWSVSVKMSLLV